MADIPKENPFDFTAAAQKDVKLAQHVAALGRAMLTEFSVRQGVEPFREAAATARKIMSEMSSLGNVNLFPGAPPTPEIAGSVTNDAASGIGPQFEPSHTFERARLIKRTDQRSREKRIRKLLAILASHPKHPHAALQIDERSAVIAAEITGPARYTRNPELLEILVRLLDVWAEANLQLITNSKMSIAYSELVYLRAVTFWEKYTGDSFEERPPMPALESEWDSLHDRAIHWEREGLKALVRLQSASVVTSNVRGREPSGGPALKVSEMTSAQARQADPAGERSNRRKAIVMPILERKRWKPGTWATKAAVGKNSIYDYLNGKRETITMPNRQAMAEALGVKASELPD